MKELEEFKKALRALALELHPVIHTDVSKKFEALEVEVEKLGDEAIASAQQLQRLYVDRNLCVALLLRMCASNRWRVGTCISPRPAPGFSRIAIIETPEKQISWHFPDADQPLFDTIDKVFGEFPEPFDGHSHDEKFERMRKIVAKIDEINTHMLGEKVAAKIAGN